MKALGDDASLIARYLDGDAKAAELLVRRYHRYAASVALGVVGDYHAADDVLQEGWIKVLGSLGSLKDTDRLRPWLRNVIRRTALDYRRRRAVVGRSGEALPGQDEDSEPLPDPGLDPGDVLAQAELREEIRAEIDRLPDTQREVVYLKYLEGLSYEEIAGATELTVNTIESRLFRARASLRKRLAARYGAPADTDS